MRIEFEDAACSTVTRARHSGAHRRASANMYSASSQLLGAWCAFLHVSGLLIHVILDTEK